MLLEEDKHGLSAEHTKISKEQFWKDEGLKTIIQILPVVEGLSVEVAAFCTC